MLRMRVVAMAIVLWWLSVPVSAQEHLTAEQVIALMAGNTFQVTAATGANMLIRYGVDGTVKISGAVSHEGSWRAVDGGYCTKYSTLRNGAEACYRVKVQGDDVLGFDQTGNLIGIGRSTAPLRIAAPASVVVPAPAKFDARPKLYVLSIGVGRYADARFSRPFAARDAGDLANVLAMQQGRLYREVELRVVRDEEATRDGVLNGLEWIVRQATSRDVAIVFLAGQGLSLAGEFFFLPHDVNSDRLARSALSQSDVRRSLLQLAGRSMLFIDVRYGGQLKGDRRVAQPDAGHMLDAIAGTDGGVTILSAWSGQQFGDEPRNWANSAFATALIESLAGKADTRPNKTITFATLQAHVAARVKALTGNRQAPIALSPAGAADMPIALLQ
jgi:hypothetical protein